MDVVEEGFDFGFGFLLGVGLGVGGALFSLVYRGADLD